MFWSKVVRKINLRQILLNRADFFHVVCTFIRVFCSLYPHVDLLVIPHEVVHLPENNLLDFAKGCPIRRIADEGHTEHFYFLCAFVIHPMDCLHVGSRKQISFRQKGRYHLLVVFDPLL